MPLTQKQQNSNHCILFEAKSYLLSNKYMIYKHILFITFLNELDLFFTHS